VLSESFAVPLSLYPYNPLGVISGFSFYYPKNILDVLLYPWRPAGSLFFCVLCELCGFSFSLKTIGVLGVPGALVVIFFFALSAFSAVSLSPYLLNILGALFYPWRPADSLFFCVFTSFAVSLFH
jgi:hypothetical protein